VLAFFGVVATCGSAYVQLERVPLAAAAASLPVGLGAVAILLANNVRDIDGDRLAGKRTLAVRLGRDRSRDLFTAVVTAIFACAALLGLARPPVLITLAALPLAVAPVRLVRTRSDGPGLIAALGATARLQLAVSVLLAAGLWLS
jgi:1,4-dihydroxy-2-naphthoate polyprenyltransferase